MFTAPYRLLLIRVRVISVRLGRSRNSLQWSKRLQWSVNVLAPCSNTGPLTLCLFPCPLMETGSSSLRCGQIPRFIGNHHRFVCFPPSSITAPPRRGWICRQASVTRYCSVRQCMAGVALIYVQHDCCRGYEFMLWEEFYLEIGIREDGIEFLEDNQYFVIEILIGEGDETILAFLFFSLNVSWGTIIVVNKLISRE